MTTRLRSTSLFWTFAGAFLGVALLGTFLQGAVVLGFLRTLSRRSLGLDAVVREAAAEIATESARTTAVDVPRILAAHQRGLDSAVIACRDSTGHLVFAPGGPPRLGPPRRDRPPLDDLPFGGPPDRGGPWPPPGRFEGPPPHSLAVSQKVVVGTRVVGEVVAWQLGPPRIPRLSPATRFLLSLPVALVLASVAGLLVFRSVLGRLRALQALAGRVAEGDLGVRVSVSGADEIGQLGLALNGMTEKLAAAKASLDRSDHERRQLFADISHELATPLTSIRGYAETLLNASITLSAEERELYLQRIHAASERMDVLIQDLLELARLEVGTSGLARQRIDWVALCRNTVEGFASRFQEAGLQLCWSQAPREAWIHADGHRMEQVIDNLLVNALHYVPREHTVWVSIVPIGEGSTTSWRLVVADDGPGFPAEDLAHVFDRFYRGENALSTNGSGLGLAIVQEIVRRHGGSIRAMNRRPQGAAIEVDLTAAEAGRPAAPGS